MKKMTAFLILQVDQNQENLDLDLMNQMGRHLLRLFRQ